MQNSLPKIRRFQHPFASPFNNAIQQFEFFQKRVHIQQKVVVHKQGPLATEYLLDEAFSLQMKVFCSVKLRGGVGMFCLTHSGNIMKVQNPNPEIFQRDALRWSLSVTQKYVLLLHYIVCQRNYFHCTMLDISICNVHSHLDYQSQI